MRSPKALINKIRSVPVNKLVQYLFLLSFHLFFSIHLFLNMCFAIVLHSCLRPSGTALHGRWQTVCLFWDIPINTDLSGNLLPLVQIVFQSDTLLKPRKTDKTSKITLFLLKRLYTLIWYLLDSVYFLPF